MFGQNRIHRKTNQQRKHKQKQYKKNKKIFLSDSQIKTFIKLIILSIVILLNGPQTISPVNKVLCSEMGGGILPGGF